MMILLIGRPDRSASLTGLRPAIMSSRLALSFERILSQDLQGFEKYYHRIYRILRINKIKELIYLNVHVTDAAPKVIMKVSNQHETH